MLRIDIIEEWINLKGKKEYFDIHVFPKFKYGHVGRWWVLNIQKKNKLNW